MDAARSGKGVGGGSRPLGCATCPGRQRNEWCALGEVELARMDRARVHADYAPGQVVFAQGAPCLGVHCVESGLVALRKSDLEGNSIIVGLAHASDTLGYQALFGEGPHSTTAVALVPSRVCFVDAAAMAGLLAASPALALRYLRRAARELRAAEQERLAAATLPARTRLVQLLLGLADRYGAPGAGGGLVLDVPLSRQDMAALLGIRPESVARVVRALTDEELAIFDGRRVTIPDLGALLAEVPEGA